MDENNARRAHTLAMVALPGWPSRLGVIVLCALLLWFSVPTMESLNPLWLNDYDYSHGYLVLVLTVFLVVLEIRRAPLEPLAPSWAGVVSLLAVVLVTVAGQASTTVLVPQLVLPALWMAAVWAFAGVGNARRFAPSLAYLYVAVPIWQFSTELLRSVTVLVVSAWIRVAGLPAFIEGNFIHVPSGTFEVQDGCAGLRYALVALALAAFAGLVHHRRGAPAALLTFFGLVLAVVGNWVRVFITVAVGQSSEQQHFLIVRDHHTFFGWALFIVFMVPLFYFDRMLQSRSPVPSAVNAGAPPATPAAKRNAVTYAALAVLVLGVLLSYRIDQGDQVSLRTVDLPALEIPGWSRIGDWQDAPDRPYFVGATEELAGRYSDGTARISAYVANYSTQRQEHEIVFSQNRPEGQSGLVVARHVMAITTASGTETPVQELEITDRNSERRLAWVGLRVAGKPVASNLAAKALQIVGAIRGRRDAQALVLTATCGDDCSEARSWLSRYATAAAQLLYEQVERSPIGRPGSDDSKGGSL